MTFDGIGKMSFEVFAGKSPITLTGKIVEEAGVDSGMGKLHPNILKLIKSRYGDAIKSPEPTAATTVTAITEEKEYTDQNTT